MSAAKTIDPIIASSTPSTQAAAAAATNLLENLEDLLKGAKTNGLHRKKQRNNDDVIVNNRPRCDSTSPMCNGTMQDLAGDENHHSGVGGANIETDLRKAGGEVGYSLSRTSSVTGAGGPIDEC